MESSKSNFEIEGGKEKYKPSILAANNFQEDPETLKTLEEPKKKLRPEEVLGWKGLSLIAALSFAFSNATLSEISYMGMATLPYYMCGSLLASLIYYSGIYVRNKWIRKEPFYTTMYIFKPEGGISWRYVLGFGVVIGQFFLNIIFIIINFQLAH
jgi:hypothetical protein